MSCMCIWKQLNASLWDCLGFYVYACETAASLCVCHTCMCLSCVYVFVIRVCVCHVCMCLSCVYVFVMRVCVCHTCMCLSCMYVFVMCVCVCHVCMYVSVCLRTVNSTVYVCECVSTYSFMCFLEPGAPLMKLQL